MGPVRVASIRRLALLSIQSSHAGEAEEVRAEKASSSLSSSSFSMSWGSSFYLVFPFSLWLTEPMRTSNEDPFAIPIKE
jgi:hypothetical protein